MKNIKFLLTAMAFCLANVALADDVVIPTSTDNPFDLTKGVITSTAPHEHFTSNGVEWMMDGDKIVYTLQNPQDADFYLASIGFDTGIDNVTVDFNLKGQNGTVVADTTFSIMRNGWYNKSKIYRVKTKKMNKGKYTLTFTFHSTPNNNTANISKITFVAAPTQAVNIPTSDSNPFDLTKGLPVSASTNEHFTDKGVDYMFDGEQLIYLLQNQQDAAYQNLRFHFGTDHGNVFIDVNLKSQNGDVVAEATFALKNQGWNNPQPYIVQTKQMKKGKYYLNITYRYPDRTDWRAALLSAISVKDPKKLNVGDEVEIENPEFSNGANGWNGAKINTSGNATLGDTIGYCNPSNPMEISQTLYDLPNGLYLLQMNAFDQVGRDYVGIEQQLMEMDTVRTFLFVNDQQVLMKNIYDDALSGQNIYRFHKGVHFSDSYFTNEAATLYLPKWDNPSSITALIYNPYLYNNCAIGIVNNGILTIGWRKTDKNREAPVFFDHVKVTYLSSNTSLQAYANELLKKPMSAKAKADLQSASSRTLANAVGRAETSARLFSAIKQLEPSFSAQLTDREALNHYLALWEEQQRQGMQMLDITIEQPGTLGDEIFAQMGNDFNLPDLKRLRIKGQMNDADLITLRDRCTGLVEIDMSKTLNTAFVDGQFQNHYYLRYVKLPDYFETLPYRAFFQCYNLNTVVFPASMKAIGSNAFERCYNLRQAIVPEGVTTLGNGAYAYCGLKKVVLPSTLTKIGEHTFHYAYELTDIQLADGLLTINNSYAFAVCTHLKKIVLPSTLQSIGSNAFENCSRLEDIQLNEGLVEIWGNAFSINNALRHITLPSSLQGLYGQPFNRCDSLMDVTCLSVAPPYTNHNNNPFNSNVPRNIRVPYLSQNVYKQTAGWDTHNILTHPDLPKNVYMNQAYNMTWPAEVMTTWKPNIYIVPNVKNTSSEGGNGGMLTYGSLHVGSKASMSADTLNIYYSFYSAKEADKRKFFVPIVVNGTARADVIRTEINISKNYWTFFSLPYDVKVADITSTHPADPFVIRTYDGKKRADGQNTEAWTKMTKDSILHARQGYIIRTTNGDFDQYYNNYFLPSINNANKPRFFTNDDVVVPLNEYPTEFAHNRSWNFIGNPYPCFFDIRAMQTTSPITIWNRSSNYETYSPLDDDYILNPGQAFFIQRPLDQNQVVFLKEGRQFDLSIRDTIYYNSSRAKVAGHHRQVFNLLLNGDGEQLDRTRFVLNESATLGYDDGLDAPKFFSLAEGVAHFYTINGDVQYAINERPVASGEILLGLQLPVSGTYSISLGTSRKNPSETVANQEASEANSGLWLIDKQTGAETDLTVTAYTFQADAGTLNSRFIIRLGAATGIQLVGNETLQEEQFFDLQGRRISQPQKGIYIKRSGKERSQGKNGQKVVVK